VVRTPPSPRRDDGAFTLLMVWGLFGWSILLARCCVVRVLVLVGVGLDFRLQLGYWIGVVAVNPPVKERLKSGVLRSRVRGRSRMMRLSDWMRVPAMGRLFAVLPVRSTGSKGVPRRSPDAVPDKISNAPEFDTKFPFWSSGIGAVVMRIVMSVMEMWPMGGKKGMGFLISIS